MTRSEIQDTLHLLNNYKRRGFGRHSIILKFHNKSYAK